MYELAIEHQRRGWSLSVPVSGTVLPGRSISVGARRFPCGVGKWLLRTSA
jgi:hypothetical protein